jgi:hypothetical protein
MAKRLAYDADGNFIGIDSHIETRRTPPESAGVVAAPSDDDYPLDPADYTNDALVAFAESAGLDTSGTKAEIADRLNDAYDE